MYSFSCQRETSKLMRAYILRHCYEESRQLERTKGQSTVTHCLIVRRNNIKNETEFGYKQELKTTILKKMHFVYLSKVQDLVTFLLVHTEQRECLFGMIMVENVEDYFGDSFDYQECGPSFLIVLKLLRQTAARIKAKGRVCMSYAYNSKIFRKKQYQQFLRSEDVVNFEITQRELLKDGEKYENEQTKLFFLLYRVEQEQKIEDEEIGSEEREAENYNQKSKQEAVGD